MPNYVKELSNYLNKSRSVYHAVGELVAELASSGYTRRDEHCTG